VEGSARSQCRRRFQDQRRAPRCPRDGEIAFPPLDADRQDHGQRHCSWGECESHVRVHPSVKKIKARAFQGCTWLRTAILNDGLEEIGFGAFYNYTSLVRI